MPRGLTKQQIGVSEAMIETYGPFVWEHSNNVQVRHGDPVRTLDFDAIERQRAGTGMTDRQIAARLGLTPDQVLQIRVILEARNYHRGHYHRLAELGGSRRFRAESHVAHEDRDGYADRAMELRGALRFDPERVREFIAKGWWADDTLRGWLARAVAQDGRRLAACGPAGAMSFADLADRSERLAGALYCLGLRQGDVVSVQLPNIPEFLITYLAIGRLGAVMSTVHMPYRVADTRTLLKHTQARVFIGMSQVKDYAPAAEVLALRGELPDLAHVVALGEAVEGAESLADLSRAESRAPAHLGPVPADPFLLLYTSGTSASPKAVPLTYQMTLGNARMGAVEHQFRAEDIVLSAAPFTHLLGLYSIHLAMSVGAANLLLPVFTPADMLAVIESHRPSVLFTAPAHLAALLQAGLLQKADLSSLRLVIVSGSACPPDLARTVAGLLPNGRFTQLWGMTELQAGLYTRPDDPIELAATTAGRPSPGTEARVTDTDDRPRPSGEEGELQVRGSLMFAGYFNNDAANRDAFTADGWFRTGDLATIDEAGNVRITGRIKDVINRGGVKYNPRDIEDVISGHPKILQAAIVAYPDPVLGERACCFAVLRPGEVLDLDQLGGYLAERGISKVKWPERLEVIDEMPMTPTRKIIKGRLRELL